MLNSTPPPKRASLLGLPVELRLRIYDLVRCFTPRHSTGFHDRDWRFKYGDGAKRVTRFGAYIVRGNLRRPEIAWLSLQRTCSVMYRELKGHLRTEPAASNGEKAREGDKKQAVLRTYEMQITASRGALQDMIWTSVPCPPSQCRVLQAYISMPSGTRFIGDGGPTKIVRDLYQTLNRFLHCGPILDAGKPLSCPITLETVKVIVRTDTSSRDRRGRGARLFMPFPDEGGKRPRGNAGWVCGFAGELEETGLLDGFVKRIVVNQARDDKEPEVVNETVVRKRDGRAEIPAYWQGHAFEWGVGAGAA